MNINTKHSFEAKKRREKTKNLSNPEYIISITVNV